MPTHKLIEVENKDSIPLDCRYMAKKHVLVKIESTGHDCEDFKEKLYDTSEEKYYWVCSSNLRLITSLSNRIFKIADSVINTDNLEKQIKDTYNIFIETMNDVVFNRLKTAGISLKDQSQALKTIFNHCEAVLKLGENLKIFLDKANGKNKKIYDIALKSRDKLIVFLEKISFYDTYAHSIEEQRKTKELKNSLAKLKKQFDTLIFKLK